MDPCSVIDSIPLSACELSISEELPDDDSSLPIEQLFSTADSLPVVSQAELLVRQILRKQPEKIFLNQKMWSLIHRILKDPFIPMKDSEETIEVIYSHCFLSQEEGENL